MMPVNFQWNIYVLRFFLSTPASPRGWIHWCERGSVPSPWDLVTRYIEGNVSCRQAIRCDGAGQELFEYPSSIWWPHVWDAHAFRYDGGTNEGFFSMALVVCGNLGPWLVNWPPLLWALALSKVARKPPISLQSLNWFIMAWPMFRWVIKQVVKVNLMSPRFMVHLLGVLARWLVLMEADSQVNWS